MKVFARTVEFTRNTYPNGPPYICAYLSPYVRIRPSDFPPFYQWQKAHISVVSLIRNIGATSKYNTKFVRSKNLVPRRCFRRDSVCKPTGTSRIFIALPSAYFHIVRAKENTKFIILHNPFTEDAIFARIRRFSRMSHPL